MEIGGRRLGEVGLEVADHDGRAGFGETAGDALAEPLRASGDDRAATRERDELGDGPGGDVCDGGLRRADDWRLVGMTSGAARRAAVAAKNAL
jgi:hypothetical protein